MAKFGRFDPRNKKQGRNKQKSLYKDIRMHENDKDRKIKGVTYTQVIVDDPEPIEEDYYDFEE
jgi:hypothetical protein